MFESILMQVQENSTIAAILGIIATLIPTISIILKQWSDGKFTKEQLKEKGEELRAAYMTEENLTKVTRNGATLLAELILANNDGKVTQEEYDRMIANARQQLIDNAESAGINIKEIVDSIDKLRAKTPEH